MKRLFIFIIIFCASFGFMAAQTEAAEGMTLSLTPPLIKNNINPGEIWRSAIKVINNNSNPVNIYISTLDFKSGKDNGTVEFIKSSANLSDEEKQYLLSQWIVIDPGPIEIPAFGSKEIPFIIDVPENAGPGGHYAAILAGTKPPAGEIKGTNIKISSLLASLILLNINGDVKEIGRIREFSTNKKVFYQPDVKFTVRFENLGNVHIQPQGEIKVYNFFNKEKKVITLNHNSEFGNVLPGGIRRWNFSFAGEKSLLDMGRYRAELVLSYGERARETINQTIFFWIIYPRPLAIALGVIIGLILIFVLMVRRYIKKSIARTQARYGISAEVNNLNVKKAKKENQAGPAVKISKDALNLKSKAGGNKATSTKRGWSYFKRIMVALMAVMILILALMFYLNYRENYSGPQAAEKNIENAPPEAAGKKKEEENLNDVASSSSAIDNKENSEAAKQADKKTASTSTEKSQEFEEKEETPSAEQAKEKLKIKVLNGSGRPGAANDAANILKKDGYLVEDTANADSFNYNNSIIKYKKGLSQTAGMIAGLFSEVADVQEVADQAEDIIIIVGKNYK